MKEKKVQLNYIKIKQFSSKDIIKRVKKKQPQNLDTIHIPKEELRKNKEILNY